jgi:hypothetical protein
MALQADCIQAAAAAAAAAASMEVLGCMARHTVHGILTRAVVTHAAAAVGFSHKAVGELNLDNVHLYSL